MAEKSSGSAPPVFSSLPCAFQYSPSLNCIIALSNHSGIEVLDVHSCSITTRVPISNSEKGHLGCNYLDEEDKLIISSGGKIGCRSTSGEQIFLNTILQVPDIAKDDKVTIELDIVKAGLLLNNFEKCIQAVPNHFQKELFEQVTTELKKCYEKAVGRMQDVASPELKWLTVCLTMEHDVLMKTFNSALLMGKQDQRGPGLPVIGDVLQQLTFMQKTTYDSISSEKRLMFNEVDRLQTFNSWPHMNYKWALPGPMAEAGFYHPHNTPMTGEDRAMCFTCSVCLVSWESSDQPWSEHKRHSRNCPYVTGEYTENVPLQVYTATARPQELQRPTDKIVCMSSGGNNLIATGTEEGFIVIWSIHPTLKVHSEYQISVSAISKDRNRKSTKEKSKDSTSVTSNKITTTTTTEPTPKTVESPSKNVENTVEISIAPPASTIANTESAVVTKTDNKESSLPSKENTVNESNDQTGTAADATVDVDSYFIIDNEVSSPNTTELHNKTTGIDKGHSQVNDSILRSKDVLLNGVKNEEHKNVEDHDAKSTGFERKCNITSVAIKYDEKCSSTHVVAGVRIESRKFRKTKIKTKTKLSLLVYKLAGKVKTNGTVKENHNKPAANPYPPMGYDFTMDSDNDESYLASDPYVDLSQLSVIDEYLMAAHKNPMGNGGTQNIALMNEVKSGFDQQEIVQIDDIKTVYEDCVFHKFDIDKTYYSKDMVISHLLVVENYLVAILKKGTDSLITTTESTTDLYTNVILVFSIQTTQQQVTEIKLVNSRTLTGTSIHDAVQVLYKNLPPYILSNLTALEQFDLGEGGGSSAKEKTDPKMLLLAALSDNTLSFLTVPKLAEQKLVTTLDNDRWIYKIAYCNPLLSVAICDNKGYFHMQPCVIKSDKSQDVSELSIEVSEEFKKQLASGLKMQHLKLLTEMTKYEPVTQGCYVFFPVNWYFSRAGSSKSLITKPALKHMFHLSPLDMDKRLVKWTEQLGSNSSKTDFVFHMFVMVKTTIGYLDVLVNLKLPLKDAEDFQCCVYIDNNNGQQNRGPDNEKSYANQETLIYGPVLFSSVLSSGAKSSGQFTIMVPEMICKKSLSVIVKLKPVVASSEVDTKLTEPTGSSPAEINTKPLPTEVPPVSEQQNSWSQMIKDIYVGVHQFKREPANTFCFPGCQSLFAKDESVQLHLVNQLLQLIEQNGNIREGFEIKLIMGLLLWIASVHCHAVEKDRLPLVSILLERIPEFLKATLLYGDRSLCHSCCQLLIALKRTTVDNTFTQRVIEEVWKLIPHIHNASSSAAVHWIFVLLLEFLKGEKMDETVLKRFTTILYDVGKVYGNGVSEIQRTLDARYGLADPIFQPVLKDPMYLKMKSGNTTKKAFARVLETTQVSTDHLPGILEVQPLHFACLSVSEGAKAEQMRPKSSDAAAAKATKLQQSLAGNNTVPFPIYQDTLVPSMLNTIAENAESMHDKPLDLMAMISDANGELPYYDIPLFGAFPNIASGGGLTSGAGDVETLGLTSAAATSAAIGVTTMLASKAAANERANSSSYVDTEMTQEDSVIPLPCCLLVDKMHIFSVHHAILDFKTPVYLTDLIVPPCRALASITISTWDEGVGPEEEIILASSDEINLNALVLSNMVSPVQLRYIKILVVGGDSCSAVIPLGQYYGYQKLDSIGAGYTEKLQRQFGDVFCRYALAADRILASPEEKRKTSSSPSSSSLKVVLNNLKKNYSLCSHLQLCLNFLNNNLAWCSVRNLLQHKDLKLHLTATTTATATTSLSDMSFSDQQLVLTSLLKTILFYFDNVAATAANTSDTSNTSNNINIASTILSKDDFLLLFKKVCVYGIGDIQELATCVLYKLCGNCSWWEDVVIEVFQMCFAVNPTVPIPKRRLFNVLMKLMQCSKGLNTIVEKLLHLLQQQIKSLLSKSTMDVSTNPMSLDWILMAITQILDREDINMWNFFSPWAHVPNTASSTSTNTPTQQAPRPNKPSTSTPQNSKSFTLSASTPNSTNDTDGQCSSEFSSVEFDEAVEVTGDLFLSKSTCIPVLSSLLDFILSKLEHGNADQSILACKVSSLILIRCQGLIHMSDFLGESSLRRLLCACLSTSQERKWLAHSINLLLQSIVTQKDIILKEVGIISSSTAANTKKEKARLLPPFADKELPGGSSNKGITDQSSKKFEQMKAIKESMNKKFFDATDGGKHFTGEKFGDAGPIAGGVESLAVAAVQCNVIHPVSSGFHRILEADILSLQNSTWRRKYELSTSAASKRGRAQKLWIPSSIQYGAEVMSMKSATMSFILDTLLDLITQQGVDAVQLQCLHQLLFFLQILHQQNIDFHENTATKLCNTCLAILTKSSTPMSTNPSYQSILKKITKILLGISTVASSFSLQLLQVSSSNSDCENVTGKIVQNNDEFLKLHLMSLQRLVAMTDLGDQERTLLKELLLKISCIKDTGNSKLLTILNDVLKNGAFLQWSGDKEVEVTLQLLLTFSRETMDFVKDSTHLLYAAHQDRYSAKRTVFLLNNGKCRLSGKSHMAFTDTNLALLFVSGMHEILNTQALNDHLQSFCMEEAFSNLFQTLGCFGRLSTVYKAHVLKPGSAHLIALPEKMVSFQAASKLHPLAAAIVYVLSNASGNKQLLPVVIKALVKVLSLHAKQSAITTNGSNSSWSLVGAQQFMKNVLTQSSEAQDLFINQGGFNLIVSEVLKNSELDNMSWVDVACRSHILQEIHSLEILCLSKNALQRDKLQKDEDGDVLENFAPYAKIIGPAASPGSDVLLGNKSPLRRSRFPAWGHQFQEGGDDWVTLDIMFPFEIMLKEIVIYMHGNYVIGAPSSVLVEVASMSSLTTTSPSLVTGGLQSIVLHFAQSLICKKLRLRMCRPNGADQLKLNLIELFGKSIFSVDDSGAVSMVSKTLAAEPWIGLFSLLAEQESMMNEFFNSKHFDECLSCLVKSMPFLTSSCLQQVAGLLMTGVVPFAIPPSPSNASRISNLFMEHVLRRGALALYNPFQLNLMIKFLADVISASEPADRESIYCELLDWFYRFLQEAPLDDALVVNVIQILVFRVFEEMTSKGITLSDWKEKYSLIRRLKELLTSDLCNTNKSLFVSLGQLLNTLESITSCGFASFYVKAQESLETIKRCDVVDKSDEIVLQAVMFCCCPDSRDDCFNLLDYLARHFCSLLKSKKQTTDCSQYMRKLLSLLNIFCTVVSYEKNTVLRKWFYTEIGRSFWEPLMTFLTNSGHELAGNSLLMHQFLRQTILLFKKVLYLNPETQEEFCKILFKVLSESNARSKFMSGYLKFILHRLVISEETVTVNFKPRSNSYALQHSHETQLRLSSTIGEITHTLLKYRNPVWGGAQSNNRVENGGDEAASSGTSKVEKNLDSGPLSEYEYVFQIGNAAVSKRKSKYKSDSSKHSSSGKSGKSVTVPTASITVDFFLPEAVSQALPLTMTIGQILHLLHSAEQLRDVLTLEYTISSSKSKIVNYDVFNFMQEHPSMPSMLERFATNGGLPLLTCCDTGSQSYIKLFSLILPLPGFASVFLKDRTKAELLLRLMLGVKETQTGQQIQSLVIAQDLSTLPLLALRNLLQQSSIQSDEGYKLRKHAFERGVVKFVLNNLKMLYYQTGDIKDTKHPSTSSSLLSHAAPSASLHQQLTGNTDHTYWAKGTGFGTGSTVSNWDIDKAMKRKKKEEEEIVIILQVLTAFIRKIPNSDVQVNDEKMRKLTSAFEEALSMPHVLDVLTGYLRNDSVLDMSRHIPLYHAVLALIRPLAYTKPTLPLLVRNKSQGNSIVELLIKLKNCVGMYNSRLKATIKTPKVENSKDDGSSPTSTKITQTLKEIKKKESKRVQLQQQQLQQQDLQSEADYEDLSLLLADINSTTDFIMLKVDDYQRESDAVKRENSFSDPSSEVSNFQNDGNQATKSSTEETSAEELYVSEMVELQFDTYELVVEKTDGTLQFNVPYHYANMVRAAAKSNDVINAARARRLAQEVASLSTSLPISYSSTVFLQCDEERLDVMKVLITGPEGTPYENGCFEFDIYFPPDYPTSPMSVNLQTTGKHTVRFNPNLYNDGKVCLSILNTWHGRPEEKWNAQTSNLLQVLVSIQSLILVADPYFNEPGYERLRNTPQGMESSSDYNAKIQQACVRWAILEQIKRPSPCFKEIVHKHFLHKKDKVFAQCQSWVNELKQLSTKRKSILHSYESLKSHFAELKLELAKLEKVNLDGKSDMPSKSENTPDDAPSNSEEFSGDVSKTTGNAILNSVPNVIVTVKNTADAGSNLKDVLGDVIVEYVSDESDELMEMDGV